MADDKITVENVNTPGRVSRVDAAKYAEMRAAMAAVLPAAPPGMTVAEIIAAVKPQLSEARFPGGATAGWWVKAVQLDLEAKGLLARSKGSPLRHWLVG
jgi:hypothetical protein